MEEAQQQVLHGLVTHPVAATRPPSSLNCSSPRNVRKPSMRNLSTLASIASSTVSLLPHLQYPRCRVKPDAVTGHQKHKLRFRPNRPHSPSPYPSSSTSSSLTTTASLPQAATACKARSTPAPLPAGGAHGPYLAPTRTVGPVTVFMGWVRLTSSPSPSYSVALLMLSSDCLGARQAASSWRVSVAALMWMPQLMSS